MSSNVRWIPAVVVSAVMLVAVPALRGVGADRFSRERRIARGACDRRPSYRATPRSPTHPRVEPANRSGGAVRSSRTRAASARTPRAGSRSLRDRVCGAPGDRRAGPEEPRGWRNAPARQLIDSARQELQRMRRMFETGLVNRSQLADAETALAMIEAGN